MSWVKNVQLLENIRQQFTQYDSFIITDYKGLDVKTMSQVRRKLSREDAQYKVLKNKLVKIVLNEQGILGFDEHLKGSSAFVFMQKDIIHTSKVLYEYIQSGKIKFKRAYIEHNVVGQGYVERLAKIPSKEVVLTNLVRSLQAPVRNIAILLNSPITHLCLILKELHRNKTVKQ